MTGMGGKQALAHLTNPDIVPRIRGGGLMRASLIITLLLGTAACDQIPGTEAYKLRKTIEGAEASAAYGLIDPSSAQFRSIAVKGEEVCGEVNGKNRMGAYVGFARFIASQDKNGKWSTKLDPQFDQDEYSRAQRDCETAGSIGNYALARNSCEQAIQQIVKNSEQFAFDLTWKASCD